MCVYVYTGSPGGGKSVHAASEIRRCLRGRRPTPVIANVPIDPSSVDAPWYFAHVPNEQLSPAWLDEFAAGYWERSGVPFREGGILLVLDEAQLVWNSRTWNANGPAGRMAWIEFLSQHRKMGYDVILIAQSDKMIDSQFRALIEFEVHHRAVKRIGFLGALAALPFRGLLFVRLTYYYATRERLFMRWCVPSPRDLRVMDTRARFARLDA